MSTTLKLAGLALGSLASWPGFGLLDICGHGGRCQRRMPRVSGVACGWKTPWRPAAGGTVGRDLPTAVAVSEFGAWRVWKLLWARIANFADGKGEDCSGFGSCQHFLWM